MAKTRTTTSEKSMKDCFIEVRGNASFASFAGRSNKNNEVDRGPADSNIDIMPCKTKKVVDRTSEISSYIIDKIRKESLEDTDDSESGEIVENQKLREKKNVNDETGDDDKSDYGAESFCSDDSCKGSEVTNVTSRSSLSGYSSLLRSSGLKYDKTITDLIKSRSGGDRRREDKEDEERSSLLGSEMKYLSDEERTLMIDRRQLTHSGRRNMSFTNEELRKIERENQLLLKKIMSHQKPQNKSVKAVSGPPRTSSSAINRKRQQKKIEEDNMILLRRIQQVKPCAMPRTSAPGCRLATM